jgi:hypothetical protein
VTVEDLNDDEAICLTRESDIVTLPRSFLPPDVADGMALNVEVTKCDEESDAK